MTLEHSPQNAEKKVIEENFIFQSEKSEADKVASNLEARLQELGWAEEEAQNFSLAVSEAVANAIVHGNKNDPNKKVSVEMKLSDSGAEVTVIDEGKGFDASKVLNPTKGDGLMLDHGRGLFLITEYAEPEYFDGQGKVILRSKRKDNRVVQTESSQ